MEQVLLLTDNDRRVIAQARRTSWEYIADLYEECETQEALEIIRLIRLRKRLADEF